MTRALNERPSVKEAIDKYINELMNPSPHRYELIKKELKDVSVTDDQFQESGNYVVNILNSIFPGYWSPKTNIIKEIRKVNPMQDFFNNLVQELENSASEKEVKDTN